MGSERRRSSFDHDQYQLNYSKFSNKEDENEIDNEDIFDINNNYKSNINTNTTTTTNNNRSYSQKRNNSIYSNSLRPTSPTSSRRTSSFRRASVAISVNKRKMSSVVSGPGK